jgi:large subunit ribosomal protein L9
MDIILKKYHKGLGEKNDIVTVKPGFARNFLIPQGIASLASETNRKVLAENIRQAAHRVTHLLTEANKIAEKVAELTLTIEALAGPNGQLFGTITPQMVHAQLETKGVAVERQRISFEAPIKRIGSYEAILDLHKDIKATVKVEVVAAAK